MICYCKIGLFKNLEADYNVTSLKEISQDVKTLVKKAKVYCGYAYAGTK